MANLKKKMDEAMAKIINDKKINEAKEFKDLLNKEVSVDIFEKEQQELEERWRRAWEARWNRLLELEEQMENSPIYKNDTQKRMFEKAFEDLVEEEKEYLRYKTLLEQRIEECRKKTAYDQENDFKEIASMLKISGIAFEIKDGAMYIYPSETIGHSVSVKDGEVLHTVDKEKPAFLARENFVHSLSDSGLTAENVALLAISMKVDPENWNEVYKTMETASYAPPKTEEEIQEVSKENIERLGLIPKTPSVEKLEKFTEELKENKIKEIKPEEKDLIEEIHKIAHSVDTVETFEKAVEKTDGLNPEKLQEGLKEAKTISDETSLEKITEINKKLKDATSGTLKQIEGEPHKTIGEFISNWYEAIADRYKENKIKREEVKLNRELSKAFKNLTVAEEKFLKECEKIEESLKEQETIEKRAKSVEIQGYEHQLVSLNEITRNYKKLNSLEAEEKENVQELITEELKKHKGLEGLKGLEFEDKIAELKGLYEEKKEEANEEYKKICIKYKDVENSFNAEKAITANIVEEFERCKNQIMKNFTSNQEKKEQIERLNEVSSQLKEVSKISEKSPEGKAQETIEHLKKLREELKESQEMERSR